MTEELFKDKKCRFDSLKPFGFKSVKGCYFYKTNILEGQFELEIKIHKSGEVQIKLSDVLSGDEYYLHKNENLSGAFISKVREEYQNIINKILTECFVVESFKSSCAKSVISFIKKKYGDELEFLWDKTPDCAVSRRKDNKKWYLVIMTVKKDRFGFKSDDKIEVMNLMSSEERVKEIVDNKCFFPAYHMNKKYWYSIYLDRVEDENLLFELVEESYKRAGKKN